MQTYKWLSHCSSCIIICILIYTPEKFIQCCITIKLFFFLLQWRMSEARWASTSKKHYSILKFCYRHTSFFTWASSLSQSTLVGFEDGYVGLWPPVTAKLIAKKIFTYGSISNFFSHKYFLLEAILLKELLSIKCEHFYQ